MHRRSKDSGYVGVTIEHIMSALCVLSGQLLLVLKIMDSGSASCLML